MPDENNKPYSTFDSVMVVVIIGALTLLLVLATGGMRERQAQQEQIGKELCEKHNFIYKQINLLDKTIVCLSNITYNGDHYNITPETLTITIKPDWDYYTLKKVDNNEIQNRT